MKELIEKVRFFANLLRNEHMNNYDNLIEDRLLETMEFFIRRGFMKLSDDKSSLTIQNAKLFEVLQFFGDII